MLTGNRMIKLLTVEICHTLTRVFNFSYQTVVFGLMMLRSSVESMQSIFGPPKQ